MEVLVSFSCSQLDDIYKDGKGERVWGWERGMNLQYTSGNQQQPGPFDLEDILLAK
jgi:hypothetical protein